MKRFYQRSFTLALFFVVLFLLVVPVTARPTPARGLRHERRQKPSNSSTAPPSVPSNNDAQTIEIVQVFTMFGGNTTEICTLTNTPITLPNGDAAIVFSKSCTSSFTPSSSPASTQAAIPPTTSSSTLVTTIVTSEASTATGAALLSMFTTDGLPPSPAVTPTPVGVPTNASASPNAAATANTDTASGAPANHTGAPIISTVSTSLGPPPANATAAASTSSSDPFTSTAQSHLSSLPIFLGAFGGIAGLALLVVGFKVYGPVQRFNELRLKPPGFVRRLRSGGASLDSKKWWRVGEHDGEKMTTRTSLGAGKGSGQTDEQVSGWIS